MEDLDARMRALSDLDREPLIHALIQIDHEAQRQVGAGRRAKFGSMARNRAEEAAEQRSRLGRIIYFLRFRSPATDATTEDTALCQMLSEKLRAKRQWTGEYSG